MKHTQVIMIARAASFSSVDSTNTVTWVFWHTGLGEDSDILTFRRLVGRDIG